jgi:two-component system, NtrC family, response regulator AtoC
VLEQCSSVESPAPPVGGAAQAVAFDASGPFNPPPDVVVASARTRDVYSRLSRAAQTTAPVLILGETGTGKDVVAHSLHALSKRADRSFVVVNCGAIPESLLESELFGHERGAFSGAASRKIGPFERAQGGTLFLDEVGELSLACQASLLRVLESRRVMRVGGSEEIPIDVRVVSATNRCLRKEIAQGRFRPDFLFRLETFTVHVPPLRERPEEIEPFARLFLDKAIERWELRPLRLAASAVAWLRSQSWPGNVRQLKNVVERVAVNASSQSLNGADFEASEAISLFGSSVPSTPEVTSVTEPGEAEVGEQSLMERVRRFEAKLIRGALKEANGNQTRAAALLGIPRRTLANKIHAYGLLG